MKGVQENPPAGEYSKSYEDPSKIWSIYISEAEKYDKAAAESWKDDMDGILIFAGLFSAVVTAFITESYKGLKPDPEDLTVALLGQISQQLLAISNGSQFATPTPAPNPTPFIPSSSIVRVNILWLLSLAFSLGCALTATLVQQWARNYIQATKRRPAPHKHARIRTYLWHGAKQFKLTGVVRAVPLLLHISVCLFFVGLVDFLGSINQTIGHMILVILIVCCALYGAITILPSLYRMCPYRTPLSGLWWHILQLFGLLRYVNAEGKWLRMSGKMADGPEREAMKSSSDREERDLEALRWTVGLLTEDAELEPFIEGIPEFIISPHVTGGQYIMEDLLAAGLGNGIYRFLSTACRSPILDASPIKQHRIIACLDAILHVTRDFTGRAPWVSCFGDNAANLLHQLQRHESPSIAVRAHCAAALAACRLSRDITHISPQARPGYAADVIFDNSIRSLITLVQSLFVHDEHLQTPEHSGRGLPAVFRSINVTPLMPQVRYTLPWAPFKTAQKIFGTAIKGQPQRERSNTWSQYSRPSEPTEASQLQNMFNGYRFLALIKFVHAFISYPTFASETPFAIDTLKFMTTQPVLEAHPAPEGYQDKFVRLLAEATNYDVVSPVTSQIPPAALDILFDVAATLGHPASMEGAVGIINGYLSHHPGNVAAENAVRVLRVALSGKSSPMEDPALLKDSDI